MAQFINSELLFILWAERLIKAIGGFFYRLFGYGRVADTHFERGYTAGLDDGFQDAVDNVQDWYAVEEDIASETP